MNQLPLDIAPIPADLAPVCGPAGARFRFERRPQSLFFANGATLARPDLQSELRFASGTGIGCWLGGRITSFPMNGRLSPKGDAGTWTRTKRRLTQSHRLGRVRPQENLVPGCHSGSLSVIATRAGSCSTLISRRQGALRFSLVRRAPERLRCSIALRDSPRRMRARSGLDR